jgi:hypothetical protein
MPREIEQDPMFQLLTDALRAGPGSPEWREAVSKLKDANGASDEYSLILQARERLESGKEWRSIRAGAGFTRKIMDALEREEAPGGRGIPTAKIVAIIAVGVLITLIATGIYYASNTPSAQQSAVSDLNNVFFAQTISAATFEDATPTGWRAIGALPLAAAGALSPTTIPAGVGYIGGGLVCETPAPAHQPFCVEAQLRLEKLSEDVIPQVFVTDDPTFSSDRGTSGHELVWLAGADGMRVVLPDGRVAQSEALRPSRNPQMVRIQVGKSGAIVEFAGRKIWSGPHQLREGQPWYVGVRFLAKSGSAVQQESFTSVKLLRAEGK